nr:MAG TPA: hypothetical protein [Caudoviricetes sp.]
MTIAEMRDKIRRSKDMIQSEIVKCMDDNKREMVVSVREQLYSGIDGRGAPLFPSYSQDPYFLNRNAGYFDEVADHWVSCYMHPERYIDWKMRITPPVASSRLGLPARSIDQPNLFIFGTFHGSIDARAVSKGVEIFTFGWDGGPQVERKYGSQIFALSSPAVAHFNTNYLMPWLRRWFMSL